MRPLLIFHGLLGFGNLRSTLPSKPPADLATVACCQCWHMARVTERPLVWTDKVGEVAGGLCMRCQPSVLAAIDEVVCALGDHGPAITLLTVSRIDFLRRLGDPSRLSDPAATCGWCRTMTWGTSTLCRGQIARCAATAAVKRSGAAFIGRLPLPTDVQGIILSRAVALCNVGATIQGAADLLLAGYHVV